MLLSLDLYSDQKYNSSPIIDRLTVVLNFMFNVYSGVSVESDSVMKCKMQNLLMIDFMFLFFLIFVFYSKWYIISGIVWVISDFLAASWQTVTY